MENSYFWVNGQTLPLQTPKIMEENMMVDTDGEQKERRRKYTGIFQTGGGEATNTEKM